MALTETAVREALRTVVDPELGINIVDLGLVYRVDVDDSRIRVVMTMTSPACPLGDYLKDLVRTAIASRVPEARDIQTDLVWEPRWSPDMMSEDARRQLGQGKR